MQMVMGSYNKMISGTINGAGANKVADFVWQTSDKRINYTLLNVNVNQSQ
jgi:hypothetical protein